MFLKTSLKESGEATNFKNKSLWIFVLLMQKNKKSDSLLENLLIFAALKKK